MESLECPRLEGFCAGEVWLGAQSSSLCSKGSCASAEPPWDTTKPLAPTPPHCRGFVSCSLVLAPVVLGFVLPVSFRRQSREPGLGSCCLLGHTVGFIHIPYPAFMVLLLLFPRVSLCSVFSSLAGFAAQAMGAPRSADWTPLQRFLACSVFGVNIPKPRRGSSNFEIQIFS